MIPQLSLSYFSVWRDNAAASITANTNNTNNDTLPVVLDVRELSERQIASIKEDRFTLVTIPMPEVSEKITQLQATYGIDHPIACLCHHGMRSLEVAKFLAQQGFSDVVNLQGGIDAWAQQVDTTVPRY